MANKKHRLYARFRFSDSHIKKHRCRGCRGEVAGHYVAAVYRGGRGNWLFDPFHVACAPAEDAQLAAELIAQAPARWPAATAALAEQVGDATFDPSCARVRERPYRDTGGLYRVAPCDDACGLCGEPCAGLALLRPRQDRGERVEVPFHLTCAAKTEQFDWQLFLQRARQSLEDGDVTLEALLAMDGNAPVRDELASSAVSTVALFGTDRKRAARDALRWDLYFDRAVDTAAIGRLLGGELSWQRDRIAELRPTGKTTTAKFRDQVLDQLGALEEAGLFAAHFCTAGDTWLSRARSLAAVGDPPFPFAFLGRGQHPDPEWRVRVRFDRIAPEGFAPQSRFFREAQRDGRWLTFRSAYEVARDAPYLDSIRRGLDEELVALHAQAPIDVAILGDGDNQGPGDAWHEWSLRKRSLQACLADSPSVAPIMDAAAVGELVAAAREQFELAGEMGDPSAGREVLDDILERIPRSYPQERKQVEALLHELIDAML